MEKEKEFFIDGSKLDYHPETVRKWHNKEQIYPIHVEISPSSGCNQRCILCCVDYKHHNRTDLSEELMQRLPEDLKEAGVKSFLLAGEGEPLLNKNCIPFLKKSKKLGIDAALTTNGVLFNPDVANQVLHTLSWLRFSIQTFNPTLYEKIHRVPRYNYYTTLRNIAYAVRLKKIKNLPVKIGVQQILINENADDLVESARKAKELGIDYWTIKRFSKHPNNTYDVPEDLPFQKREQLKEAESLSDENFKVIIRWNQFESQPRTYSRCIGLPFITQILADGNIFPCCQFFENNNMAYGNLYQNTFKEIMSSEKSKAILKNIEENYDVNENKCMSFCRHHSTNLYLWKIKRGEKEIKKPEGQDPEHVNFI